jgi:hypothetical protein
MIYPLFASDSCREVGVPRELDRPRTVAMMNIFAEGRLCLLLNVEKLRGSVLSFMEGQFCTILLQKVHILAIAGKAIAATSRGWQTGSLPAFLHLAWREARRPILI